MTTPASASDFDAAKNVADQLKGIDKERQERVLRWVAESLGLEFGAKHVAGVPTRAGEVRPVQVAAADDSLRQSDGRPVDVKSFVDSKKPKSDVQFAAVIAYYYRFEASPENRRETIDAKILQEAARLAGYRRPRKPLVALNNAKTLGYLDAPARGQFQINSVGENLVAMTLPGSEGPGKREKIKGRGGKLRKR